MELGLILKTNRSGYTPSQTGGTMTIKELINELQNYDEDLPVYFSNDNGYTYGSLDYDDIKEINLDEVE